MTREITAAEAILRCAADSHVRVCFANPGTTEMAMVSALDAITGMRAVLGLFEGVCTGAADGYGRMTNRPALTLLHLGPGFANGIANLHNARRANSPIVNLIGDHATWHLEADSPLTSDIDSLVRPVSHWTRRCGSPFGAVHDMSSAIEAAGSYPKKISTLILPTDVQEATVEYRKPERLKQKASTILKKSVHRIAKLLAEEGDVALLLGRNALSKKGLDSAAAISDSTGVQLLSETFVSRAERGEGLPKVARLPYFPEPATALLRKYRSIVLVGAKPPVSFFGYKGKPSSLVPNTCTLHRLAADSEDAEEALTSLAIELNCKKAQIQKIRHERGKPLGALTPESLGQALLVAQPANCVIVDESATSGGPYGAISHTALPHTVLQLTGGAIGQGLPCATGAAIACPDRAVIALQADGSALYTVQALWTQARENLNVTTIICSNRSYRILRIELARAGENNPGDKARSLTDLGQPPIDWISVAKGFGVPATRVQSSEDLTKAIERSVENAGPHLIEAIL